MNIPPPVQFSSLPCSAAKAKIKKKLALTHTSDPNRSTSINFVHVNGRSLYSVDRRRMVVVEGENVLHHVTRGQSNLTKSASRGAHSPVMGHPRGSKFVPLNSWGIVSY